MRLWHWAEAFEDSPILDDIPARVRRTETQYWLWVAFSIALALMGFAVILVAPSDSIKLHAVGLCLFVDGGLMWAVIKVWVHIRLAMYWMVWDRRNRLAAERYTVEAHDL